MTKSKTSSILAAECGSTATTVALIESIDDHYRLVATGQAPSSYGSPWHDITVGLQEAVRQIEAVTQRTLLAPGGWPVTPRQPNQTGVDAFVAVSSAGPPLAVALAGLMHNISLTSARRATATAYTHITTELALDSESSNRRKSVEAQIQALQSDPPDVIFLAGGTDGGAQRPVIEMANAVLMALHVLSPDKPDVLFAGNQATQDQVVEILGEPANLKTVNNVRPTLESENLIPAQLELETLYRQRKMFQVPGFDKLRQWTRFPPVPAGRSFEQAITYLGQQNHLNVLGANIGSGATMVSAWTPVYQGTTILSDAGVGHSVARLLKTAPLKQFRRWLPFDIEATVLHGHLLNKSLHPGTIPTTYEELMIEYALAREALRLTVARSRTGWPPHPATGQPDLPWNMLVGAGQTLTRAPSPHYAAMILLDAVEPWGVTTLALDHHHLLNKLGVVAAVDPVAAVEVTEDDFLLNLGTLIAPLGHGVVGQTALNLKIDTANGLSQELDVPYGALQVVPLPPGHTATVEMRPARYLDIGVGQPGRSVVAEVEGGILGLIIDARGRPLRLPRNHQQRQERLSWWEQRLAGQVDSPREVV